MSFFTLLSFYFYRLELSKSSFNKGNDVERKDCLTGKIFNELTVIWSKSIWLIKFQNAAMNAVLLQINQISRIASFSIEKICLIVLIQWNEIIEENNWFFEGQKTKNNGRHWISYKHWIRFQIESSKRSTSKMSASSRWLFDPNPA